MAISSAVTRQSVGETERQVEERRQTDRQTGRATDETEETGPTLITAWKACQIILIITSSQTSQKYIYGGIIDKLRKKKKLSLWRR